MANIDDFNAKLETITAIPNEKVETPPLPVNVFAQESEDLFHWSTHDAAELAVVNITQEKINDLPVRAGACREAQSVWFTERFTQDQAQKDWKAQSPAAYYLRNDLLKTYRYAFRGNTTLLGRVAAISEGTGDIDMIQDLNDLAVLGRENTALLTAIGFDLAQLDVAATTADTMADLLATANGDKLANNESKLIRDKAYTHLKELVDDIREAGKYVFRNNPERYKGYVSQYWKKKHRKKAPKPDEISATEGPATI